MTSQDSDLYELCKEVYERFPEWVGTVQFISNNEIFSESEYEDYGMSFNFDTDKGHTPLYTSDYLLEKLPKEQFTQPDFVECLMVRKDSETSYTAGYFLIIEAKADTPLKALLKLTIALSEAGELNE